MYRLTLFLRYVQLITKLRSVHIWNYVCVSEV